MNGYLSAFLMVSKASVRSVKSFEYRGFRVVRIQAGLANMNATRHTPSMVVFPVSGVKSAYMALHGVRKPKPGD
jgi:hypothetical protein